MPQPLDRRDFTRRLAAGAAAIPLAAAPVIAADPAKSADEKPERPRPTPAELVTEQIRQLDPDRLTPQHLAQLKTKVAFLQARSELLSSFPLTNADEPAIGFAAYRHDE
jgi:hypothetical protein